jgi:uncharacterized tellurite resistance protein B-like protein
VVAVSTAIVAGGQALNLCVPAIYVAELLGIQGECRPLCHYAQALPSSSPRQLGVQLPARGGVGGDGDARPIDQLAEAAEDHLFGLVTFYLSIIRADGRVSPVEMEAFTNQMSAIGVEADVLCEAVVAYDNMVDQWGQDALLDASIREMRTALTPDCRKSVVAFLGIVALSDGIAHEETVVMQRIVAGWDDIPLF